jgi:methylthioribose-1-phosphate isomerase
MTSSAATARFGALPVAVRWEHGSLALLDQRLLPDTVRYLTIGTIDEAIDAIRTLAVRGAPAIGIAAAYALAVAMREVSPDRFVETLHRHAAALRSARPTAVNLGWAVDRLVKVGEQSAGYPALVREAERIHEEDRRICRAIGVAGRPLITPGCRVLTHCNAGALAVSELGTATAPMYLAHAEGVPFRVFADETRPLLQGARLTAWELSRAGIDVTVLCDDAAASLMAAGEVDMVLVGTDRVTANGDVVNKIGTLGLAVLCDHYDVPFYVACPSSTFDPRTPTGADVTIEQRDPDEVLGPGTARVAAYNPAFDVTPAPLVTALITDRGLILRPAEVDLPGRFAPP